MKKTKTQKGITLVALIITIIVLLILAVVAIRSVTGDGIIQHAKNAQTEYEQAQKEEASRLLEYEYQIASAQGTFTGSYDEYVLEQKYGLKIGDYVNYVPGSVTLTSDSQIIKDLQDYSGYEGSSYITDYPIIQENLNWRVLDIKDGSVRLISDKPTTSTIYLKSFKGYNNAVYLINELCNALYSGEKGNAKGLKIEDIEEKLSYNYKINGYGNIIEYTLSTGYIPAVYEIVENENASDFIEYRNNISEQTELIERNNDYETKVKLKRTYWNKTMVTEDFISTIYYNLFIESDEGSEKYNYCLASRDNIATSGNGLLLYVIRKIQNGAISFSDHLETSNYDDFYDGIESYIRPVVTLNSSVQIDDSDASRDGTTIEKAWNLR